MPELLLKDIATLGRALRARQVTSWELTRAYLERSEALGHLNAWIRLAPEQALAAARRADAELRHGRDRGPLHGIPLGIKDNMDVAGLPTTAGTWVGWGEDANRRRLAHEAAPLPDGQTPARRDAPAVARLRKAGAVFLGKNHLHELAYGVIGTNPHWGDCHNPVNPDHATGGSSSGSGAAVAAGLCAASVGTDTAGSVRIPAAACGVIGLKPTWGHIPLQGVVPGVPNLDHAGPLARTVADAALLYRVMSTRPAPYPSGVRGLRLGIWQEAVGDGTHPEVRAAFLRAVAALEGAGAGVREVSLGEPAEHLDWINGISLPVSYRLLGDGAGCAPDVAQWLIQGAGQSAADYLQAEAAVQRLRRRWHQMLRTVDAVLSPTLPIPVPRRDAPPAAFDPLMWHTSLFNLVAAPAITVPCGTAGGLPAGLQVSGGSEAIVLQVAAAWEPLRG